MGNEWETAHLTDLYDISSGLSKSAKFFGSGFPFVAFKDVMYNFFLPRELSQLVQSTEEEQRKCSVQRGDVFLTRTSETMNELGMSSVAVCDYANATFNGFTKRLRPKADTTIVPEFVAYYLRSPKFRAEMRAFSTMSTRASLNNEMISRLKISFPSVAEQRAIGHVLKTLDDKIELNRRMNETLESMARALFKSWFVDFDPVIDNALAAGSSIAEPLAARASAREALGDQRKPLPENIRTLFPASFIFDEEMGWIPEGWEISRVEDVSVAVGMGPFGSNIKTDTFVDTGVPIVNGQQLNGLLLQDGKNNFITESHAEKLHKSLVYRGDLVFTHRGTIGQVSLVPNESEYERYIASQSQMYLRPDSQLITSLYLIHLFQSHLGQAALLANRSQVGVPSIARPSSHLKNIRLLVPDRRCLQAFDNNCSQWIERIAQTRVNTKVLAKLRDTLLPKLLSGELRIPEAEKLVADNV